MPEKNLNRYDILDRIAVGGMAEVFLAKAYGAHGFEKTLAIKRILPELARDPEFEERFIAEAKVAVRLSHTNVVQVFDFGRFAGSLFIAMEYVDGLDLAALLRRLKVRGERIPVTAAFQIAIELARGLDFAHSHGVVHRDVSPSNILLSRAGEVKIADFGIAIAATPRGGTVTGRRKVMGKWRYMSPEQARGEQLDTRSDLFSAASVMYELFTGEKLFPGDEAEDIIRNIHDMPLPRPSEVRPGLPPRLDAILHAALARSREDRPARPAVMLRALTELTYESSIVSTALDVAELVSDTVDRSTPTGKRLDAIIRAQLVGIAESTKARRTAGAERRTAGATVERDTAEGSVSGEAGAIDHDADHDAEDGGDGGPVRAAEVTVAARRNKQATTPPSNNAINAALSEVMSEAISDGLPVLIQRIDSDGISRLELDETTIGGAPWTRVGEPPPMPTDERTPQPAAVGVVGKAARQRPRVVDDPAATALLTASPPRRPRWLIGAGAALIGTAAVIVYLARGGSSPAARPIAAVAIDAGVDAAPALAHLTIDSNPSGATGTVAGVPFGPTPATIDVAPGVVDIRVELAGFAPYVRRIPVSAGANRIFAELAAARAQLKVISRPPGASVQIEGDSVGVTPLELTDLVAASHVRVTLDHPDFVSLTVFVDLVAGKPAVIDRALRPTPPVMGTISLQIEDGWGDVYLKGKKIGKAPNQALQLPVGRHHLRVVNPPSGRQVEFDVDVDATKILYYSKRLP